MLSSIPVPPGLSLVLYVHLVVIQGAEIGLGVAKRRLSLTLRLWQSMKDLAEQGVILPSNLVDLP